MTKETKGLVKDNARFFNFNTLIGHGKGDNLKSNPIWPPNANDLHLKGVLFLL